MDTLQTRVLQRMLDLIGKYQDGRLSFHALVEKLEGVMAMADPSDSALLKRWYENWTALKEMDADVVDEADIDPEKALPLTEGMRTFLETALLSWGQAFAGQNHRHSRPRLHVSRTGATHG